MVQDAHLRELYELRNTVDELIEEGLVKHWSVSEVLGALLPRVVTLLGAKGAFVETYGEDLEIHLFTSSGPDGKPLAIPSKAEIFVRTSEGKREKVNEAVGDVRVIAQHLDVAGEWFGRAGLVCPTSGDTVLLGDALEAICEVLDNYLFAIKAAREKHNVMMRLGRALRHRVLGEGVKEAVKVLAEAIPMDQMVLVYVAEESATKTLHVQMFKGAQLEVDTLAAQGQTLAPIRAMGRDYLNGKNDDLLEHLGVKNAAEEVLINGITKSVIVGKVVVTSRTPSFNTYDRELLSAFAGFIRQRVVDFNKEWRALALAFRPDDVGRLLQNDDYEKRFLAPREETVGIVYIDISGFTRVSETILKTPAKVAELVEEWSRDAVDIVWQHGGVFDKMVGDCVIALFGPPFYEETPGERLARAIQCAIDVRAMTDKVPQRVAFEALREAGLAVSTGVHLAPLFVGQFGPNSNFTGFSSGMNNTARLQGCAGRNEILVMEEAIAALPEGHGFVFGETRAMPVKNVAEPLKFRALDAPMAK
ncbi:MAG TPA: adenylate/guanylate cyclase domain-containing protein [Labilithrix sp.]|nr:adenylate/guanylate cyclase domain-containing protein [Labilithrix sp.]